MMSVSYHVVHYRFCQSDQVVSPQTLETIIRGALNERDASGTPLWNRVEDRVFDIPQSSGKQIVMNKVADLSSALFGEICLTRSDGLQTLLNMQKSSVQLSSITNAEIFMLNDTTAPSGTQFVNGMVYWLCIGMHLFFVKTQSMTADLFQQYISWFVAAKPSNPISDVKLQAQIDQGVYAADIGDIRSLRVSGRAMIPMTIPVQRSGVRSTVRSVATKVSESEMAKPIVELLFGPERSDSLLASLGPNEYVTVDSAVKVRGTRTQESRQEMLNIASELADLTDAKVQIEGKDGLLKDGDAILRTNMPFELAYAGSNLLEFDNVADRLQEVYARFVADGKIRA